MRECTNDDAGPGDWEQITRPLPEERAHEALASFSMTYRTSKLHLFKCIRGTDV